jgi:uncharacterized membrane protein
MTTAAHLWAVGFDTEERADQVREQITQLGWGAGNADKYLLLLDVAVVVRHHDGSFTLERESIPAATNVLTCSAVGFLAGLAVAAPLIGAAVGAAVGGAGAAIAAHRAGISDEFVRQVEQLMKPGSSALFLLDRGGEMDVVLHKIKGLGGTILKTNVDLEQAKLIQATLSGQEPAKAGEKLNG